MPTPSTLSWHAARVAALFWRFRTLPLGRRLAAGISSPYVLSRPFHGRKLAVDVSRTDTHRLLFLEGERFIVEADLLQRLLRPGMRVVDVGANIGYYAIIFAAEVGPEGAVQCFEPDPDNWSELERNVRINGLSNVSLHSVAVGSEDSVLSLKRGINATVHRDGGDMNIQVRRLDSLELGRVDFVKIDVEGYECEVLKGARKTLEAHRPTLFIEVHPDMVPSREDLLWILRFLRELYGDISAHRGARPPTAVGKALSRYIGRGSVASTNDSQAWVEEAVAAPRAEPFWIVARNHA